MSAREYTTDEGIPIYCSDIIQATKCPYTGELVDVIDVCYGCKNHHDDAYGYMYCLRPSDTTAEEIEQ